jgi:hypothetical protein
MCNHPQGSQWDPPIDMYTEIISDKSIKGISFSSAAATSAVLFFGLVPGFIAEHISLLAYSPILEPH